MNKEAKYTAGPWVAVDKHSNCTGVEIEILGDPSYLHGGAYLVCKVENTLTTPRVTTSNALLIAAAPELLEALQASLVAMERMDALLLELTHSTKDCEKQEIVLARAAITKATTC